MSNEVKVGDWTVTEAGLGRLNDLHAIAFNWQQQLELFATECCDILGIDAAGCSLAKDFAEEIVLQGVPVDEAIRNIQQYLESPHSADFS